MENRNIEADNPNAATAAIRPFPECVVLPSPGELDADAEFNRQTIQDALEALEAGEHLDCSTLPLKRRPDGVVPIAALFAVPQSERHRFQIVGWADGRPYTPLSPDQA